MPKTVKEQHQNTLQNIAYQVQNWQSISQNVMQAKQQELYEPVYRKAINAIQIMRWVTSGKSYP